MMYSRSLTLAICSLLLAFAAMGQPTFAPLNLDLEYLDSSSFPRGWVHKEVDMERNKVVRVDSNIVHHGKYSLHIDWTHGSQGMFNVKRMMNLPATGHKITLKGYLKTENVEGFAGLWLRVDGDNGPLSMDNMMQQKIDGTHDWKEYTIELEYDAQQARRAAFGGIVGWKGMIWIDDLHIYIDDVEVTEERPSLAPLRNAILPKSELTSKQIKTLASLGSLWGFLKYHHPAFTSGKVDADKELLRLLDKVYNEKDKHEIQNVLSQWLDSLGTTATNKQTKMSVGDTINSRCKPAYNVLFNKQYFSKAVREKTKQVLDNMDCSAGQYYAASKKGVIVFENEDPFYHVIVPDWRISILALFRYWNVIEYFYPYRYLIDNWEEVLQEQIPVFFNVATESDYLLACQGLICKIEDAHARNGKDFVTNQGHNNLPPLKISYIQNKTVIEDVYAPDGDPILQLVSKGDVITKIKSIPIDMLLPKFLPVTSGSNIETRLRDVWECYLLRAKDTTLNITVAHNGVEKNIAIPTVPLREYYERKFSLKEQERTTVMEDSICYVPLSRFSLPFMRALLLNKDGHIKRVIIDIRKHAPSQELMDAVHTFIGYYVNAAIPYALFSYANYCYPGYFPIVRGNRTQVSPIGNTAKCPFKLLILVDEHVQSSHECLTMALQCVPDAITIGSTTAGADGDVTILALPGNILTQFTGLGVYYPDGGETQRKGVRIDHTVRRTIEGIQQGRDELIEAAKRL